jgi:hypothetical protein
MVRIRNPTKGKTRCLDIMEYLREEHNNKKIYTMQELDRALLEVVGACPRTTVLAKRDLQLLGMIKIRIIDTGKVI